MKCHKNKMSVFNLGVVFGPTLLRSAEETLAAILDIKFNNVVIEILIENYDLIFKNAPGKASEYLQHAQTSPSDAASRPYYRTTRQAQPLMRVVTRVNYTETGMSTSLQNIPNGMTNTTQANTNNGIYQNTNNKMVKSQQQHPIYDTKSHMNQSTPTLTREVNHLIASTRELNMGRDSLQSSYLTSSSPNSNHHLSQSPIHRSGNR